MSAERPPADSFDDRDRIKALIERTLAHSPAPEPLGNILTAMRRPAPSRRWPPSPTRTLMGAAAIALLAALVAASTWQRTRSVPDSPAGSVAMTELVPIAPAVLPDDLQLQDASSVWWDSPAARAQRFVDVRDPSVEITVVTEGVSILGGTPDGDAGSDDGLRVLDGMNPATFSWIALEDGGVLSDVLPAARVALVMKGAGEQRARLAVEQFVARSTNPFDGYDPAPGSGWQQEDDRSAAPGRRPAVQQLWRASDERAVYLATAADVGVVPLAARAGGFEGPPSGMEVIGGQVVLRSGSLLKFQLAAAMVTLAAPGLSDEELGDLILSLQPLSAEAWEQQLASANAYLAEAPLIAEVPTRLEGVGAVSVELRALDVGAVLCVRDGAGQRCTSAQFGVAGHGGPAAPGDGDAAWFGSVSAGGRPWLIGMVGAAANGSFSLELEDGTLTPLVPVGAPQGHRVFAQPLDGGPDGQLPVLLSESNGAFTIAPPR